jgi:hypothetical protein
MRPLFGIAITSGHCLSSSQYGRLNYQTLIPAKGRSNPTVPFRCTEPDALKRVMMEPVLCGM